MNRRHPGSVRLAIPLCAVGAILLAASLTGIAHASPAATQRIGLRAFNQLDVFMPASALPTAPPRDFALGDTLAPDERISIQAGMALLDRCAPSLYDYVRSHITLVTRGDAFSPTEVIGYVRQGESTIYLPKGTILGDTSYPESARAFLTAANLVHEARHVEMGRDSTEPDAYRFELRVFVPACYPGDIDAAALNHLRQYIQADAYPARN